MWVIIIIIKQPINSIVIWIICYMNQHWKMNRLPGDSVTRNNSQCPFAFVQFCCFAYFSLQSVCVLVLIFVTLSFTHKPIVFVNVENFRHFISKNLRKIATIVSLSPWVFDEFYLLFYFWLKLLSSLYLRCERTYTAAILLIFIKMSLKIRNNSNDE